MGFPISPISQDKEDAGLQCWFSGMIAFISLLCLVAVVVPAGEIPGDPEAICGDNKDGGEEESP